MRLPDWVKTAYPSGSALEIKKSLRSKGLHTVCEEARCPNMGQCFSRPTATFMILGDRCTRDCGFCSVTPGTPLPPDADEPRRVALAAKEMGLKYVVVTSVTRDDLPDGGAGHFAETIKALKDTIPGVKVEVLTPDFSGSTEALREVISAGPDVFNHNVETVPSLYPVVRPQADYKRSLAVLNAASQISGVNSGKTAVKSGIMLGLGEKQEEVVAVLKDLLENGCVMLTAGQYLRPGKNNLPVAEYIEPARFEELKQKALEMGFKSVASGPLVRSSMNAEEYYGCMNSAE
ncbi:MAG: lipoyl synthase [Nitrospiraceae bacterium]|nr:lipoyl synthase [Nitrospiraceae bacterium]